MMNINGVQWKLMRGGNMVIEIDKDSYVSYNSFVNINCFMSEDGSEETALTRENKWFILNGDFTKECSELKKVNAPYEEYLKLFEDNEDVKSDWSSM